MKNFVNIAFIFFCTIYGIIIQGQNLITNSEIILFLKDNTSLATLHYPKSVIRFYTENDFEYAWIQNNSNQP